MVRIEILRIVRIAFFQMKEGTNDELHGSITNDFCALIDQFRDTLNLYFVLWQVFAQGRSREGKRMFVEEE